MEEITSAEATYGIHALDTALTAWYRQMNDLAARGADRTSDELLILDMRIRIVEGLRAKFETDLYGEQPPAGPYAEAISPSDLDCLENDTLGCPGIAGGEHERRAVTV